MPTQLYKNIDYTRIAKALEQINQDSKRVRGIEFPNYDRLPDAEKTKREAQIGKLASDCGCKTGARIAAIAVLLYVVLTCFGLLKIASNQTTNYLLTIPVFIVAAIVGKLVGLKRIQQQLATISNEIRAELLRLELDDTQQRKTETE